MPDAKDNSPQLLEGNERVVVQTLMPISLIWDDFLARHEYVDGKTAISVNVEELMNLVTDTNNYIKGVYEHVNVTQEQFDEIANKITPLLYPEPKKPEPPETEGKPA